MTTWCTWYLISGGVDICGRTLSTLVVTVGKKMWEIQNKLQYSIQWLSIISKGLCFKLHEIKRCLLLGRKVMTNLHSVLKSRDITFPTKMHIVKGTAFPILRPPEVKKIRSTGLQRVGHDGTTALNWTDGFSTSHIWMPELDSTNDWATKNWRLRTVLLEKILKCPVDGKEIKPGNSKGNQLWIFIGRTDAEAPVLWLPDAKSKLIGKDIDAGKDWEGGNREWDGCMAWPNQGTKIWGNSGR